MRLPITLMLITALAVAGCGRIRESRLNPFNWFGRSTPAPAAAAAVVGTDPGDGRALVAQVTAMEVTAQPGGAIVRATGLPPTQGWWKADLLALNGGEPVEGVLTYRFVIVPPPGETRVSTPQSREVTAAVFVSDKALAGVRTITVQGAEGSRSSRR